MKRTRVVVAGALAVAVVVLGARARLAHADGHADVDMSLRMDSRRELGAPPPAGCALGGADAALLGHVREHQLLDAHGLAQVLLALCPTSPARDRWRVLDALVLDELDEPLRAEAALAAVARGAPSPERETAAILLARAYLRRGDQAAFARSLDRLPATPVLRLRAFAARDDPPRFRGLVSTLPEPAVAARALAQGTEYEQASRTRRPWLAGTLSAIVPGTGQVYAGSWQGGVVAFVLNAVLIGATVELGWRHLYVSAGAAGVAASVFYVGNVLNAADLAQRRNEQAARPSAEALERLLIPEAYP